MKILLDECVTKRLKSHLSNHEVSTVVQQGWSGLKNGDLIKRAIEKGFKMLLTIDKNLRFQQNTTAHDLIIVVIDSPSSKIEDIIKFLPSFNQKLISFKEGRVYVIKK